MDDGVQAGLFTLDDLADVPLIGPVLHQVRGDWPHLDPRMTRMEAVRRMIGVMVDDVLAETERRLAAGVSPRPTTCASAGRTLVQFSDAMMADLGVLRAFLFQRMYRHYRVNRTRTPGPAHPGRNVPAVHGRARGHADRMGRARPATDDAHRRARAVCDYIAGMTDRYAVQEHRKLFSLDVALDL